MPRKPIWPPRIQFHKSSGQDRVRIFRDGVCRSIYLGRHGTPEAREKYLRVVAELGAGIQPTTAKNAALTVAEAVSRFLEHSAKARTAKEHQQYVFTLTPLLALYGNTPAADFGPKSLRTVMSAMASGSWMSAEQRERYQQKGWHVGLCRNVLNRRLVRIKTAWRWLVNEELVPPSARHALEAVTGYRKGDPAVRNTERTNGAPWEHIEQVAPLCPAPVGAMLRLQWLAGMRSCEVRMMRTVDVDTSNPACWIYRPEKHKNDWREGDVIRAVPLGPRCQEILRPWLKPNEPEVYLFVPTRRRVHKHYTDFTYPQAVRRACAQAGVTFRPYACRHSAAERVRREFGVDGARAFLGQKSVGATGHYLSERDNRLAAEVATKLA